MAGDANFFEESQPDDPYAIAYWIIKGQTAYAYYGGDLHALGDLEPEADTPIIIDKDGSTCP